MYKRELHNNHGKDREGEEGRTGTLHTLWSPTHICLPIMLYIQPSGLYMERYRQKCVHMVEIKRNDGRQ